MGAALRPRLTGAALMAAVAVGNAFLVAALVKKGFGAAVAPALAPLFFLLFASLLTTGREYLLFAALIIPLSIHAMQTGWPVGGGLVLYAADFVVLLAVGSWCASRLAGNMENALFWPRTPVLGWPFALFAGAMLTAILRGHEEWGQSLLGPPTRLIIYAGLGVVLGTLEVRRAYRGIVLIFYVGTVWMFLNAVYFIATGNNATGQGDISTGGTRVLSGTIAALMTAALFLALLNMRVEDNARRQGLHLTIALLATACIALAYVRTIFIALVILLPLLLKVAPKTTSRLATTLPLALPFLALVALILPRIAPTLVPTFISRITASPTSDVSVEARQRLDGAAFGIAKSSPLIGVGFGAPLTTSVPVENNRGVVFHREKTEGLEGHNSMLWLLAAGGIAVLGSFLLLIGAWLRDLVWRVKGAIDDYERSLLIWCGLSLPVFLIAALAGPVFGKPSRALIIWAFLLIPAIVPRRDRDAQRPGARET